MFTELIVYFVIANSALLMGVIPHTTFLHRRAETKGKGCEDIFRFAPFFRNGSKDFRNFAG
jgi:hypothetical protein